MALPILGVPKYELTVPSTGQQIKFRPFLVKEEKALLLAHQSENPKTMLDTLKDVVRDCTYGEVDIDKLAMFDIEYIFIKLRAKSVGEISELQFQCNACNDPKAKIEVKLNLDSIEVTFDESHNDKIKITDDVGIKMKYPTAKTINSSSESSDIEAGMKTVISCIDYIYDKDTIYRASECSEEELQNFISNLTQTQFKKIQHFFETMPRLEKHVEVKCPVCGHDHKQTIKGLENFF